MNRIVAVILASACFLALSPHHANFSGTWKLNMKKSKNLPASFMNLKSYSMHVQGSDDSMTVVVEFEGSGQRVASPPTVYVFDGKERYREDTLRGSRRRIPASWTSTGQKLIVTSRVIQTQGQTKGQERGYTQTDTWALSRRNTLDILVTQKFEGSDSTNSEQWIFHRTAE